MITLQDDIIGLYNSLTKFSKTTIETNYPKPIKISYEKDSGLILFQQDGISIYTEIPIYYCLDLKKLEPTYLLPEDYNSLMSNLEEVIKSGKLLEDRICISPKKYGFDIYSSSSKIGFGYFNVTGPILIASANFVSGEGSDFVNSVEEDYNL